MAPISFASMTRKRPGRPSFCWNSIKTRTPTDQSAGVRISYRLFIPGLSVRLLLWHALLGNAIRHHRTCRLLGGIRHIYDLDVEDQVLILLAAGARLCIVCEEGGD